MPILNEGTNIILSLANPSHQMAPHIRHDQLTLSLLYW